MENEINEAIHALSESGSTALCEELIRIKGIESPVFAETAFKAGIFRPALLYQDASPETRDKLVSLLEQYEPGNIDVNGCLMALAAIGDDTVAKYFIKWEENPPAWRGKLYAGPYLYAMEGSWCIEDGRIKPLHFDTCYALEETDNPGPGEDVFGGTCADKCPHCGSSYVNNLIIDGNDKRLSFLGINGRIKIKYCSGCLPYAGFIFCKYKENGESTVICHEYGENYFCNDKSLNRHKHFVLSKKPVPKNYCDEFERCAVGGIPAFVDDPDYAACPECGRRMVHIAQLNMPYTDVGTEYIQICKDCKIAAITYQQT